METRASYILVGSFVLGLVAVMIGVVTWLADQPSGEQSVRYVTYFKGDVTGLGVGSPVRYRGVPVGSTTDIRIDPGDVERIRVEMDISSITPVKTDTVAQLALQGITGVAFVQLTGGTNDAEALKPEDKRKLPEITSRESALQQLLTRLPEVVEKVLNVADRVTLLFDEKNLSAVENVLENLERASKDVGRTTDEALLLMKEGKNTAIALRETAAAIQTLARKIDGQIDPVASDVRETSQQMRLALGEFHKALKNIRTITDEVDNLVETNKTAITDFSQSGLYEFSRFISESRTLVNSLTRLADRIDRDPAQFFFGDSQKGVVAP